MNARSSSVESKVTTFPEKVLPSLLHVPVKWSHYVRNVNHDSKYFTDMYPTASQRKPDCVFILQESEFGSVSEAHELFLRWCYTQLSLLSMISTWRSELANNNHSSSDSDGDGNGSSDHDNSNIWWNKTSVGCVHIFLTTTPPSYQWYDFNTKEQFNEVMNGDHSISKWQHYIRPGDHNDVQYDKFIPEMYFIVHRSQVQEEAMTWFKDWCKSQRWDISEWLSDITEWFTECWSSPDRHTTNSTHNHHDGDDDDHTSDHINDDHTISDNDHIIGLRIAVFFNNIGGHTKLALAHDILTDNNQSNHALVQDTPHADESRVPAIGAPPTAS